jgi:hypothetical protein
VNVNTRSLVEESIVRFILDRTVALVRLDPQAIAISLLAIWSTWINSPRKWS